MDWIELSGIAWPCSPISPTGRSSEQWSRSTSIWLSPAWRDRVTVAPLGHPWKIDRKPIETHGFWYVFLYVYSIQNPMLSSGSSVKLGNFLMSFVWQQFGLWRAYHENLTSLHEKNKFHWTKLPGKSDDRFNNNININNNSTKNDKYQ